MFRDDCWENSPHFFASKEEAIQARRVFLERLYSETYYLSHGEYDRPFVKHVRKVRNQNKWIIPIAWRYYPGTLYRPEDGAMTNGTFDYWLSDDSGQY